jgi:single-stranded-DNA-specific exonuclease
MRGLTRRWHVAPDINTGSDAATPTGKPLLERVLEARGMTEPSAVRRFCEPRLTDLHDPSLMPGIDRAAQRLATAIRNAEPIVIYGDYDVDGISAAAILYHAIRAMRPDAPLRTYVPHRLEEGYGLNSEALRQLRDEGAAVVVSVDCGVTAAAPAAVARSIGLDLIITDHHNLPAGAADGLDGAFAVVHPRMGGGAAGEYPFPDLCGAGVAFKLAWHLATTWSGSKRVGQSLQQTLLHLLPLAALGTIADVVPLVDENRVLARFGLRYIKQTPIEGLNALIEAAQLMDEGIDCEKVGFVLGPRLNACGRMGHAAEAVHLLTEARGEEARRIAGKLTSLNRQRQQTERTIFEQAARKAEDCGMARDDCRVIILADERWHPGVVGIVCSRLAERFGRPAILLQRQGDLCRGSARSIPGYSIHEALTSAASHLETYGGHDAAAGLTLRADRLEAFVEAMTEHANSRISVDQLTPSIRIDCDASMDDLTAETVESLANLSPFGRANPRPVVRVPGLVLADPPKQIGGQGAHLSLNLKLDGAGARRWMRAVWWRRGSLACDLAAGMSLDIAIEPKINHYNGRTTVEGEISDVRILERERVAVTSRRT